MRSQPARPPSVGFPQMLALPAINPSTQLDRACLVIFGFTQGRHVDVLDTTEFEFTSSPRES
jgi:hypothetical protein